MSARKSWAQEMESAYLYGVLADSDSSRRTAALFAKLAGEAGRRRRSGRPKSGRLQGKRPPGSAPRRAPGWSRSLVRRLGPERLRSVLAGMKVRGMSVYRGLPGPGGHAMPHSVEEVGRRHRDQGGGDNLRPAVFGASDGLVSNVCLILGVAGASASGHAVLVSGVAGLLAGALLDGGRRVRLGAVAARDVRAPDRRRAGRAAPIPRTGGGRAVAHLPGARAGARRTRIGPRPTSSPNPSGRWTRWRARSWVSIQARSARRVARGLVVVRLVRARRRGSAGPFLARRGSRGRSARRWS